MSGPEFSAAAHSSSPPSTQSSESAAAHNYSFLVHSQKTLTQNLPPRVDNKLLARQKRRRTSPEDHAILESEYRRNPKPDKTTRANIVSRVSLGEKEVQIWFQNRRQNDRRKSKPLQPHEFLARPSDELNLESDRDNSSAKLNHPSDLSQDNEDALPEGDSFESDIVHDDDGEQDPLGQSSQTSVATSEFPCSSQKPADEDCANPETPQKETNSKHESLRGSAKRKRSASEVDGNRSTTQAALIPSLPHGFKSPPSLRLSLSLDGEAMVRKEGELTPSPPQGRNALRISMSADGKAVIRSNNEPSPSKNRISMFSVQKPRFPVLRRSSSAVVLGTPHTCSEKERTFGRSRDPRNWESFFDTDARSALSTPASSNSTPNNVSPKVFRSNGPHSLTRSLSTRHIGFLTPASPDHLSTPVPHSDREKRRKISRTVSSLGRLESNRKVLNEKTPQTTKTSKTPKDDAGLDLQCGDSDKENWIPGTRISHVRRRAASHHYAQRPVLKDSNARDGKSNKNLTSAGRRSRLSQGSHRKTSAASTKSLPNLDADVSAFMAGGSGASQEEDLDCIQGLLSLSQGAWR